MSELLWFPNTRDRVSISYSQAESASTSSTGGDAGADHAELGNGSPVGGQARSKKRVSMAPPAFVAGGRAAVMRTPEPHQQKHQQQMEAIIMQQQQAATQMPAALSSTLSPLPSLAGQLAATTTPDTPILLSTALKRARERDQARKTPSPNAPGIGVGGANKENENAQYLSPLRFPGEVLKENSTSKKQQPESGVVLKASSKQRQSGSFQISASPLAVSLAQNGAESTTTATTAVPLANWSTPVRPARKSLSTLQAPTSADPRVEAIKERVALLLMSKKKANTAAVGQTPMVTPRANTSKMADGVDSLLPSIAAMELTPYSAAVEANLMQMDTPSHSWASAENTPAKEEALGAPILEEEEEEMPAVHDEEEDAEMEDQNDLREVAHAAAALPLPMSPAPTHATATSSSSTTVTPQAATKKAAAHADGRFNGLTPVTYSKVAQSAFSRDLIAALSSPAPVFNHQQQQQPPQERVEEDATTFEKDIIAHLTSSAPAQQKSRWTIGQVFGILALLAVIIGAGAFFSSFPQQFAGGVRSTTPMLVSTSSPVEVEVLPAVATPSAVAVEMPVVAEPSDVVIALPESIVVDVVPAAAAGAFEEVVPIVEEETIVVVVESTEILAEAEVALVAAAPVAVPVAEVEATIIVEEAPMVVVAEVTAAAESAAVVVVEVPAAVELAAAPIEEVLVVAAVAPVLIESAAAEAVVEVAADTVAPTADPSEVVTTWTWSSETVLAEEEFAGAPTGMKTIIHAPIETPVAAAAATDDEAYAVESDRVDQTQEIIVAHVEIAEAATAQPTVVEVATAPAPIVVAPVVAAPAVEVVVAPVAAEVAPATIEVEVESIAEPVEVEAIVEPVATAAAAAVEIVAEPIVQAIVKPTVVVNTAAEVEVEVESISRDLEIEVQAIVEPAAQIVAEPIVQAIVEPTVVDTAAEVTDEVEAAFTVVSTPIASSEVASALAGASEDAGTSWSTTVVLAGFLAACILGGILQSMEGTATVAAATAAAGSAAVAPAGSPSSSKFSPGSSTPFTFASGAKPSLASSSLSSGVTPLASSSSFGRVSLSPLRPVRKIHFTPSSGERVVAGGLDSPVGPLASPTHSVASTPPAFANIALHLDRAEPALHALAQLAHGAARVTKRIPANPSIGEEALRMRPAAAAASRPTSTLHVDVPMIVPPRASRSTAAAVAVAATPLPSFDAAVGPTTATRTTRARRATTMTQQQATVVETPAAVEPTGARRSTRQSRRV